MTSTPQLFADEVSLEAKLAFLRQPSHYPDPTHRIEAIETHMSWVFLPQRLAGDVYIGTDHLVLDGHGQKQRGGVGKAADWLVKMRRLPADRMLDHEIKSGMANQETMRRIAERLASFHHDCEAIIIEPAAHCERLRQEIDSDRLELSAPAYGLDQKNINRLCAAQRNFLQESSALIAERMAGGKIIEGHGDLRPEHVCL